MPNTTHTNKQQSQNLNNQFSTDDCSVPHTTPPHPPNPKTARTEQLPVADDAGRCSETSFVEFEIPVPAKRGERNSCAREVQDLETQCSSAFGWERFSSRLYAATDGTVAPASAIVAGEYTLVRKSDARRIE